MLTNRLILAAALLVLPLAPAKAVPGVWTVIGGVCFNPAGHALPAVAAIHNPHCTGIFQPPPNNPPPQHHHHHHHHVKHHPHHTKQPVGDTRGNGSATGQFAIGCMAGAATGTMIGAAVVGGSEKRQLTINEAYWAAGLGCPVLLPLALIAQATCPDNPQTKKLARLAWLYAESHGNQTPSVFTDAYYQACRGQPLPKLPQ